MLQKGKGSGLMSGYSPKAEMAEANLGHGARTKRAVRIVEALLTEPKLSLPRLLGDGGSKAAYALLSNSEVTYEALLESHFAHTAERAREADRVTVAHDTTEYGFVRRDNREREHLSKLSTNRQGFYAHNSLVMSATGPRYPLGAVGMRPFVHKSGIKSKSGRKFWKERNGLLDNESERWLEEIEAAEKRLCGVGEVVHVCDREGDNYGLIASLVGLKRKFVIRLSQDRTVESGDELETISAALNRQPWLEETRVVKVAPRVGTRPVKDMKTYPTRREREVKLSFRSVTTQMRRPKSRSDLKHLPAAVAVTIVEALERNSPNGEEPIRWVLVTSLPVILPEELFVVIDHYRARWTVEEYHKAIKSGCAFEKRQIDSAHGLLNILAITIPLAIDLLLLRNIADEAPSTPAKHVLSPALLLVLAHFARSPLPVEPTILQARDAIAALGGHLKRNGEPGWQTLASGYAELLRLVSGWEAAIVYTKKSGVS